jgi:hypothetical protein
VTALARALSLGVSDGLALLSTDDPTLRVLIMAALERGEQMQFDRLKSAVNQAIAAAFP